MTQQVDYDLLIIGGGINGVGIAADAAGRGLSVLLCEQHDLASSTSSSSSKLIHGGLRYLEHFEFRLVREALRERDILLAKAPHIITPLEFIMPYSPTTLRPAWLIRLGLFIYDRLAGNSRLARSKAINLHDNNYAKPLKSKFNKGFSYMDGWVDDARLVILNALAAREHGANIMPRTRFCSAQRHAKYWQVQLQNTINQQLFTVTTQCIINAAGPWVESILANTLNVHPQHSLTLVKGSHIVVPKLYDGDHAYILQHHDKRVIFVIPFQQQFSLIGTTDLPYNDDLNNVSISEPEIDYLCSIVNAYFQQSISKQDISWAYSGVRPLQAGESTDPTKISRDYTLELNHADDQAPLLSLFGGKITTYRKLAERALSVLQPFLPSMQPPWTANQTLPGGDFAQGDLQRFKQQLAQQYPWLPAQLVTRYAETYGNLASQIINNKQSINDLGQHFGQQLYQAEVDYLCKYEWAYTAADILWRRTKLGLWFSSTELSKLTDYIDSKAF